MFINDIKREFYDLLLGKRVLILANFDVDSISACRILQYLFTCDTISYTLIPVQDKQQLTEAYKEHAEAVKFVILINCGGTIDLADTLEPSEDKIIFVADSHRPLDVCNIYYGNQIRILSKATDEEGIPEPDEIFCPDESNDENEESGAEEEENEDVTAEHDSENKNEETSRPKKRKLDLAEAVLKRREKRVWEERRKKILFNYTQFSYYSSSTALLMFELAWKLSRDSNELLWWAVIGATEQQVLGKVESKTFVLDSGKLQSHVTRLAHLTTQSDTLVTRDALVITYEKDLSLFLYRHWDLWTSLRNTPITACHFHLWSLKGEKRLYEFLAELGLPLVQCKQKYSSMDLELRNDLHKIFQAKLEKYGLEDLMSASFIAQYGYRNKYSAADIVYALLALLEAPDKDKTPTDCFHEALECLSKTKTETLRKGLENSKLQHVAIGSEVQTSLHMGHVISAGPFLYAIIQEGAIDARFYGKPQSLLLLGRFLLLANASRSRGSRAKFLPLIVSAPAVHKPGYCLVLGLPPIAEDSPKNLLGKAFEQAAESAQVEITTEFFDSSVIGIKSEDRSRLLDALILLLG
nr:EOG090X08GG [Eulimnadia texana]